MGSLLAFFFGLMLYVVFKVGVRGFFTVKPNERAVKTSFGRAKRLPGAPTSNTDLSADEQERYVYPQLEVIGPGGPYLKMPWEDVHKVSIATEAVDIVWDPTKKQGTIEAVTKDNLTTGVNGQLRYRVSENNLYPYLFGVVSPLEHVMGFFISVLRERIANFVDPKGASLLADAADLEGARRAARQEFHRTVGGRLDQRSAQESAAAQRVHGAAVQADRRALRHRARRRADHRDRSAAGGRPRAVGHQLHPQPGGGRHLHRPRRSEQQITMSERAVEIAQNNAEAEVAPLRELARSCRSIKVEGGSAALKTYLRNMRVPLFERADRVVMEAE